RAPRPPAAVAAVPPLAWPVDGRVILSRFGPKPGGRVNDGVNIKALRGGAVRAAADGEVIYVGDAIAGFGLLMLVRHPGGTVTAYGHLDDALADRGDRVERGQPIARAGSSGEAREPQLLFQIRQGRRALDPLLHLPR
ncbi:MAG: M23 family metallopeptidase, partial [Sandarakinorhabdus sp.]|nr:M23 family metallopeptidase [Sandarakinorhabdus sp.]